MKDHIAAVCINGHSRNSMLVNPIYNEAYCEDCGALVITCCPKCNRPIKGEPANTVSAYKPLPPPSYCPSCGQPYPWTERTLSSAAALIYETECLKKEEQEYLVSYFPDLVSETPNSQLTVVRIKRILTKVGETGSETLKAILVEITCEAVRRLLGWS